MLKLTTSPIKAAPLFPKVSQLGVRPFLASVLAVGATGGIWLGLPQLPADMRFAFIIFVLTVIGWTLTSLNSAYIALGGVLLLALTGIGQAEDLMLALGDPIIWLLLAAFIIAAAVNHSGLADRLAVFIGRRARTVNQLFYLVTAVLIATAFIIPSTSGRAALTLPIFLVLRPLLPNKRVVRALALLFPTIILLSAIASLIGAGAHLVMVDMLWRISGEQISFTRWLLLGLPFALVSCYLSTFIILRLFLNKQERQMALSLEAAALPTGGAATRQEKLILVIIAGLMLLWVTEAWHGLSSALVALIGAFLVTAPGIGTVSFKEAIKNVNWTMLLFMACTLKLSEALIATGGAQWLVDGIFNSFHLSLIAKPWFVILLISGVSLLSHLFITSRTARASALLPMVFFLALAQGFSPLLLAFLATACAGFCLTLPVSAKPVSIFSELEGTTYQPADLLKLSSVLLPVHAVLALGFGLYIWPAMGLPLGNLSDEPQPPTWRESLPLFGDAIRDVPQSSLLPNGQSIFSGPQTLAEPHARESALLLTEAGAAPAAGDLFLPFVSGTGAVGGQMTALPATAVPPELAPEAPSEEAPEENSNTQPAPTTQQSQPAAQSFDDDDDDDDNQDRKDDSEDD